MLSRTGGAVSPPLDDTYIYLQYARRLATGHGFQYTDGAGPSTGASSLLHFLLLVPGWWLGFHGESFVGLSIAFGAVYFCIALWAAARTARDLTPGPGRAWTWVLALVVTAGSGHFVWGAFTGMDTGLFAAGLALVLAVAAREGPRPGRLWILTGGLGLLRPEGLPLGLLALFVFYVASWKDRRAGDAARRIGSSFRRLGILGASLLLLAVPPVVNRLVTGSALGDSAAVKSMFSETRPDVLRELLIRLPDVWKSIVLLHLNNFRSGSWNVVTDGVLMGVMAAGLVAGFLVLLSGRRGVAGILAAIWLAAGVLLGGLSPGWDSHNFRYQLPYVPIAAIVAAIGWDRLLPAKAGTAFRAVLTAGVAVLLVPGVRHMQEMYGRNCANIHDQQTKVARWIDANTHPSTRVALNDAGAIAYFSNRRTLDFVGLTSHGWSAVNHLGAGGLFEKLESMPRDERPQIMAIYPKWYPYLVSTSLAGDILMSADLTDNTICGARLKRVFRINWTLAGSGARPVERRSLIDEFGMSIVDEVDVSDLDSEAAHGYRWSATFRDRLREFTTGRDGPVVADGGRVISAEETMTIRARPREWLVMVMRTETEQNLTMDVTINGKPAGSLTPERLALAFTEPILQIPDSLVTDSTLTVGVKWTSPDGKGDGYPSYHYWFLQ